MSPNSRFARRTFIAGCTTALLLAQACSEKRQSPTEGENFGPQFGPGTSLNVNLDQCANLSTPNCSWQNGNLNGNNSAYAEGDVVPFRLAIEGLTAEEHSIHINHDFTAGGHKAYDFLASVDATETVDLCAAGGGAVSSLCAGGLGTGSAAFFPADGFDPPGDGSGTVDGAIGTSGLAGSQRELRIYGGTIVTISSVVHAGTVDGNSTVDMVVTFVSDGSAVLLVWGGHLAQSSYWKNNDDSADGAAEVSGAPWHMRTQQLDGSGNKNQDRSIQPSAIVPIPPLELSKSSTVTAVSAGGAVNYTVTITNTGSGTASGVQITDNLPAAGTDWSIQSQSPADACSISGSPGTETLNCGPLSLVGGASLTATVTSNTTTASCPSLSNTASASATIGTITGSPTDPVVITVNCPSLSLAKSLTVTAVNAGDAVNYTVSVTNGGAGTASGVQITDNLPAAGTDWSIQSQSPADACSISGSPGTETLNCGPLSLVGGASLTATVTSNTTTASCPSLSNTASASATIGTITGSPTDPVVITVNCPSLSLAKSSTVTAVNAGDAVNYTVSVTNGGAGTASGVQITDNLPAAGTDWSIQSQSPANACSISGNPGTETLNCGPVSLASNASLTVTVTSNTTTASCPSLSNTASASATGTTVSNSPTDPVVITVNCPSLSLAKSSTVTAVNAGDAVNYTVSVTNGGAGTASGVQITDNLPAAGTDWSIQSQSPANACSISGNPGTETLNCGPVSLASNASLTVTVTSNTTTASCPSLSNTASASATGTTVSNSPTDPVVITVNCPSLSLAKSLTVTAVNAGDAVNYTVSVTNGGAGTASGVQITDNLPAAGQLDWSIQSQSPANACSISGNPGTETLNCGPVSLASNASLTVTVTSNTTTASCPSLSNTASASATGTTVSNSPTDPVVITVNCPSLSLAKSLTVTAVNAGDAVNYTVSVTNGGAGTASGVQITDNLPAAGTDWSIQSQSPANACSISGNPGTETLNCGPVSLASNASLTVTVTSNMTTASCPSLSNTASASATGTTVSNSPTDPVVITVNCPNLTLTKTPDEEGDDGYIVNPGGTATFTITVTNTGAGAAFNTVLGDTLPAGLTWTDDKTECAISTVTIDMVSRQRVICNIGTLNAGGSFTVTVSAMVPNDFLQVPPSPAGTPIEIDGNLVANGGLDWANVGIDCTSTPKKGCDLDRPTGSTDDSFGQGTKEDSPVPTVVSGSIPNNKSDLLRFYVTNNRVGSNDFLYLAWERVQAPNGTTNMDFELNQSSQLSTNGVTPVRTARDILIKFDLARGGTQPALGFHRWVTAASAGGQTPSQACQASNTFPCWGKVTALTSNVAAEINTASVVDPLDPDAPRTLDALTFGEASIDLQATGIFTPGVCLNFGQAYLKSRSSDAFTSEIKDFIAPIPVSVSSCQDKILDNKAWVKADGVGLIFDTGQIKVTQSTSESASLFIAPASVRLARLDAGSELTSGTVMEAVASEARGAMDRGAQPAAGRRRVGGAWSLQAAIRAPAQSVDRILLPRIRRMT